MAVDGDWQRCSVPSAQRRVKSTVGSQNGIGAAVR